MPLEPPDGAIWTGITDGPLPAEAALAFLVPPDDAPGGGTVGGTCLFLGTTRRWTGEDETPTLHYEAYREMAEAEVARLAEVARERWDLVRVVVVHRLGAVASGEASVLCAASSAHRAPAFEACRWLIDTLKSDVPIWKQEARADGTTAWVDPTTT
ncbi:MAG: molybdenum cofactor biosynthesis protein MoaE [Bacteroidota bacterium]